MSQLIELLDPDPTASALTAGEYFYPVSQNNITASTANQIGNGTLRLTPWLVRRTLRLDRLGGDIVTAGEAGSKLRIGIYADTGYTKPGTLVVDAGQIAGDSAAMQELVVAVTLNPGLYWIGGVAQAAPTTQPMVRVINQAGYNPPVPITISGGLPPANQILLAITMTGVTAALPTTFTPVSLGSLAPRIFARAA